jgi:Domain of unknown function (DUF4177)
MAWEYKVVHLVADMGDEDEYEAHLHGGVLQLNELGKEGWELVCLLPHLSSPQGKRYHMVMKRPVGK